MRILDRVCVESNHQAWIFVVRIKMPCPEEEDKNKN